MKLDIEGAEYEVLRTVIDGFVTPAVLCVEFHKRRGTRTVINGIKPMIACVRDLERRGYRAIAVDGYDVTLVYCAASEAR